MLTFLRPLLEGIVGREMFEERTEMIFNALQNPVINKQVNSFSVVPERIFWSFVVFQLVYVLFDTALIELFPELQQK